MIPSSFTLLIKKFRIPYDIVKVGFSQVVPLCAIRTIDEILINGYILLMPLHLQRTLLCVTIVVYTSE